ncbi:hypothetical protein L210DRAFT_3537664, partial [Boletus edulis BED1]
MRYLDESVEEATQHAVNLNNLFRDGGLGRIIAVDRQGNVALQPRWHVPRSHPRRRWIILGLKASLRFYRADLQSLGSLMRIRICHFQVSTDSSDVHEVMGNELRLDRTAILVNAPGNRT